MIEIFPRRTKETFFRLDKVSFILIIDDITLFVGVKDIFHCRIKKNEKWFKRSIDGDEQHSSIYVQRSVNLKPKISSIGHSTASRWQKVIQAKLHMTMV